MKAKPKPKLELPPCPNLTARRNNHGPAQKPHVCPYADDIYDDKKLCTCCKQCTNECAADI